MDSLVYNLILLIMFSCFPMPVIARQDFDYEKPLAPVLIEGVKEINTLCPINKLTGKRANVLSILNMVTDGKVNERALKLVLQELPSEPQDSAMSDAQRFEFVQTRLSTGSPAEDAVVSERLFAVADALGISTKGLDRDSDGKIVFEKSDAPEPSNVE